MNSWGLGWGDHGFEYLSYEYIEKYMEDAWTFSGIMTQAAVSTNSCTEPLLVSLLLLTFVETGAE